ncbi:hypothetical protein ACFQ9X_43775 [Catenulispora yoronensis]
MRTMMRSTATVAVMAALAVTVGTLSTLAARAGALPADTTGSGSGTGSGVRVEITDDTRSAHSGDVIDYTVRVENDSAASYPHLEVFHLVPNGFQLVDSSPKATQEGSNVRWTADVPAGQTLVFTDQVMAGTVEESEHLTPAPATPSPPTPPAAAPEPAPRRPANSPPPPAPAARPPARPWPAPQSANSSPTAPTPPRPPAPPPSTGSPACSASA